LTKIRKIKSDNNYLEIGQIFMFANGILSSRIVSKYDCKRHCECGNKKGRPLRFRKYPREWAVAASRSISLSLSPRFRFFFLFFCRKQEIPLHVILSARTGFRLDT